MDIKWIRAWYVKRMCHLLMAFVLTAGLVIAAGAFSAQEVHALQDWLPGNGSPDDPYRISSYADLKMFSEMVKAGFHISYFELTNDIHCDDLADWEPIGSSTAAFNGHFDRNGYVIRGLSNENREGAAESDYQGLFGYVKEEGIIKNVGLGGGKIIGNSKVGSLVGYNYGTIEN